jgi:hypothetical protein
MANIYKKISYKDLQNRNVQKLNESDIISTRSIILNFVNYFKTKHLS